eukprot:Blabericola_migrator_1__2535@NODE_1714_length_3938_cov_10_293981_g1109_i0_p1_GENE_NODE_1714_length_3938_cov_10_293981_g1109_i0NODE_1714_length_3938_cov_10_293981_g1109_i0_p1_ORF_typecomplete_len1134_score200_99MMS22L_N/PF14910_6/0_0046_NODE_1714_length_3938_cov_10_293981_g1109_i0533454
MPPYNLAVSPSSTGGDKAAIFMGLLCTLPSLSPGWSSNDANLCSETHPVKKMKGEKPFYIPDEKALDEILEGKPGRVYLFKKASEEETSRVRDMAIQSDPTVAAGIKALESQGLSYVIEVRRKIDLIRGGGDGALDLWDVTGIDEKSPLYRQALKNHAILQDIEGIDNEQCAAVKKILTTVGNLVRITPNSPAKSAAVKFNYFLDEVAEVLSSLRKTNAPKALLPCAVLAVFAKYKTKYWDGVMKLAGDETATELQTCSDVLLDTQHVNNYLDLVEKARLAPPGPSCEAFDVAFGVLSEVDDKMTSAFRNLIVYLHDTVKPQVDSVGKVRALRVNEELKDEEVESQIHELDICLRNYLQCFYSIVQDFVRIERMPVPDKKTRLQAVMHNQIAGVNRKFWPALESCLEKLCDKSTVEYIRSKVRILTEHLTSESQRTNQPATVENEQHKGSWGLISSIVKGFIGTKDEVKEERVNDKEITSPLFFDLLEIVEQLETYGQIPSSTPDESPNVPETILPGDRVAICGALGFVSKPKAAALFTYLNRLQKLLQSVQYEVIAEKEELDSIEKFLNVDYDIMKTIQDKGHSLGLYGKMDLADCGDIITSTFAERFRECWSHVSAVLEGGDEEEAIKDFEKMAKDVMIWRDPEQELDLPKSQMIQMISKIAGINAAWYLAGMFQFLQGVLGGEDWKWWKPSRERWRWFEVTQDMWTNGVCLKLRPGMNSINYALGNGGHAMLCLPPPTTPADPLKSNRVDRLDVAAKQSIASQDEHNKLRSKCFDGFVSAAIGHFSRRKTKDEVYYSYRGNPLWGTISARQSDLLEHFKKNGIDTSCPDQFQSRWYDASDQVIQSMCNEALKRHLLKSKIERPRGKHLLEEYKFKLVTGFEGPNFRSDASDSHYQGFVMCLDTSTPSSDEIMNKISNPRESLDSYASDVMAQRNCKWRTFRGKERDISIFYSNLKIERDGKIFIRDSHHEGYIGSCWPKLLEELEAIKAQRSPRDVGNGTQPHGPMSPKEIVEAFARAEREGFFKVNEYYGHLGDEGNETHPLNGTAAWHPGFDVRNITGVGLGEPIEGYGGQPGANIEAIMPYWPYVVGAIGTIGAAVMARKVWNCLKTKPDKQDKQYTPVTGEEPRDV